MPQRPAQAEPAAAPPVALLPDSPSRLAFLPKLPGLGALKELAAPLVVLTEASWRVPMSLAAAAAWSFTAFIPLSGRTVEFNFPVPLHGHLGLIPLIAVSAALTALAVTNWRNWRTEQRGLVLLKQEPTGRKMAVTITRRHDTLPPLEHTPIDQKQWIAVIRQMDGLRHDDREYDLRNPVTGGKDVRRAGADTGLLDLGEEQVTLKWIDGDIRADAIDDPAVWKPLLRVTRFFNAAIVVDDTGERIDFV